ncbi:DUF3992 domain-containing protein [Lysinibacillus sp. NPDC093688]|uniref:DUF3992 domain-containing protein n=1 Tax=Lysinibacillus sp. NPDC093688 TaxID=3390577 RepID=UPI003D038E41
MHSNNNLTVHCVKVPRVLDWISKSTVIKLKKFVHLEKRTFDDLICCDFSVLCEEIERTMLWTTYGISQIGGSICINFKKGYGNVLSVFVNGEKLADVKEGKSFSGTFTHLESIEVQCNGENVEADSNCYGEFKIMLHFIADNYKINSINDIKETICYLSDCHGNPISLDNGYLITCKELTCSKNRVNVRIINELGETNLIQRVDLLIQGFVCIQFKNHIGEICYKSIFPFSEVETVAICAPNGTQIKYEITDIDCRAHVIPSSPNNSNCIEVVIILSICQSIKSVEKVIIELEGTICNPREELNLG